MGASNATDERQTATQSRNQRAGMLLLGDTLVQGETMGARATVGECAVSPVDAGGSTTKSVERPPKRILPVGVATGERVGVPSRRMSCGCTQTLDHGCFASSGGKLSNGDSVKTISDTGSGITILYLRAVQNAKPMFLDVALSRTMDSPQVVRVANGRPLQVMEMTCPVRIALHTRFGSVAQIRSR